jgi:protein subunit release factor B
MTAYLQNCNNSNSLVGLVHKLSQIECKQEREYHNHKTAVTDFRHHYMTDIMQLSLLLNNNTINVRESNSENVMSVLQIASFNADF